MNDDICLSALSYSIKLFFVLVHSRLEASPMMMYVSLCDPYTPSQFLIMV